MSDYNGWSNKPTWQVNLWFGDDIFEIANENGYHIDGDFYKDYVCEYLTNSVGKVFEGFIGDVVMSFIDDVDWDEVAKAVNDEIILQTDDDTDDDDTDDDTDIIDAVIVG